MTTYLLDTNIVSDVAHVIDGQDWEFARNREAIGCNTTRWVYT